jgi:hypothetical protein
MLVNAGDHTRCRQEPPLPYFPSAPRNPRRTAKKGEVGSGLELDQCVCMWGRRHRAPPQQSGIPSARHHFATGAGRVHGRSCFDLPPTFSTPRCVALPSTTKPATTTMLLLATQRVPQARGRACFWRFSRGPRRAFRILSRLRAQCRRKAERGGGRGMWRDGRFFAFVPLRRRCRASL